MLCYNINTSIIANIVIYGLARKLVRSVVPKPYVINESEVTKKNDNLLFKKLKR